MKSEADKIVERLITLSRKERDILVSGQLEQLAEVEERKVRLVRRLAGLPAPADRRLLERLRSFSRYNDGLYRAALAGIRRVQEQIASFVSTAELQTYAPDGDRKPLAERQKTLEHRA